MAYDSPGGTLTNLYGVYCGNNSKRGTTTNWYDFFSDKMNTGTGQAPTVVNHYSYYCVDETRATHNWGFFNAGTANNYLGTGNTGVGVNPPTAKVHIAAGTATAGTSPLKINPGVLLTVTENGAIESDGTHLYWTDSGGTRHTIV